MKVTQFEFLDNCDTNDKQEIKGGKKFEQRTVWLQTQRLHHIHPNPKWNHTIVRNMRKTKQNKTKKFGTLGAGMQM